MITFDVGFFLPNNPRQPFKVISQETTYPGAFSAGDYVAIDNRRFKITSVTHVVVFNGPNTVHRLAVNCEAVMMNISSDDLVPWPWLTGPKPGAFRAWIDKMPGANNKLIVAGDVTTPTTGWTGTITEVIPGGINPTIIHLQAALHQPGGASGDAQSSVPLRFEKENSAAIKTVIISGLGDDFEIQVGEAH